MKKLILTLTILVVAISTLLTSCSTNNGSNNSASNNSSNYSTCQHLWNNATCTTPKTCTKCNETSGVALGHTTTTGTCSRCGENFSSWELRSFVDEFDNPTGEKFISTTVFDGKFSNSATTNSKLYATVQVTSDKIAIILWEYGSNQVKCSYKWDDYSITMLDQNGTKHYLEGTMYAGGFRIYIDDADKSTVISALQKSGSVSFHLVYDEYTTSTYTFTISTNGFTSLYNQIK